ncbi:MAG: hypothetical protein FJ290_19125, partial [Planctomycetes bacterium]|nr:hypothetical protein [Planctomycetota bacterium]
MAEESAANTSGAPRAGPIALSPASRAQMEEYCRSHRTQVLTILFSDLEGSTGQQSKLGNIRAAEVVDEHRRTFREALRELDGREVETAGDSFLVVFAAPSEGVKFALRLQAAMRGARAATPELPPVRVGLHQGQVVVREHAEGPKPLDIYGVQVSTAARIMDLARGGQILCSRAVFDDARAILRGSDLAGLGPVAWCNHGPYRFKGVDDPYDVCEVGEEGHSPLAAPAASGKSWPAGGGAEELGWRPAVGGLVPGTNWALEERLGKEGGDGGRFRGEFGEVWRARSPAAKSLRAFKFCFKRDRVPALKREARLFERLRERDCRHQNLVEVYNVVVGDRPPYYLEMEYVEGPSLDEWLAASPPLGERLEVAAQVADALDTVHAAGIYHRDIKPSNILLTRRADGRLQAKLTDFGLGAAEDPELLKSIYASRVEGVAGTWDYIAPELRSGGRATAQSDLYSLGVTLFQVAAGDVRRPLGDWEREVPGEVLREDIRRCLAHEPGERWRRAAELATALRSHDERQRELALEREREQHRRRVRRLRIVTSVIGLFAAVVLAFGGFALYQWREAKAQRKAAQEERDRAVEAANAIIEEIGAATKERIPGYTKAQISLIQRAEAVYDRLMSQVPDRQDILDSKARALTSLASAYRLLGDTKKAKKATEELLAIRTKLHEAAPRDTERLWHLGRALFAAGTVRMEAADLQGATDAFERLSERLEQLRERAPRDCDWARAIPVLRVVLEAQIRVWRGLPHDVEKKAKELRDADPGWSPALWKALASKLQEGNISGLGWLDQRQWESLPTPKSARPAGPAETAKEARELVEKGQSSTEKGDHGEAKRCFKQGIRKLRGLVELDPENAPYRQRLAEALSQFGSFQWGKAGDPKGAIESYTEAAQVYQQLRDSGAEEFMTKWNHAQAFISLTSLHWPTRKQSDAAARSNAQAKAILEGLLGAHVDNAVVRLSANSAYARCIENEADLAGRPADTKRLTALYEQCMKDTESIRGLQAGDAAAQGALAELAFRAGKVKWGKADYAGARADWERCIELRRKLAAAEPTNSEYLDSLETALSRAANACEKLGDSAAQLKHTTQEVATQKQVCALDPTNEDRHSLLAISLSLLYALRRNQGDLSEWFELCRRWHDAKPDDEDWKDRLASASWFMGQDLMQDDAYEEALPVLAESAELYRQLLAARPQETSRLEKRAAALIGVVRCNKQLCLHSMALAPCMESLALLRLALKEEPNKYLNVSALSRAAGDAAELHMICRNNADEALACAQEAVAVLRDYGSHHPAENKWRELLAGTGSAYMTLVRILEARGETAAAVAAYEAQRDVLLELQKADPGGPMRGFELSAGLVQLAGARLSHGDATGAAKEIQQAFEAAAALAKAHPKDKDAASSLEYVQARVEAIGELDQKRAAYDAARRGAKAAPADLAAQRRYYEATDSLMGLLAGYLLADRPIRELQAELLPLVRELASQSPKDAELLDKMRGTVGFIATYRDECLDMKGCVEALQTLVDVAKAQVASQPSSHEWHCELAQRLGMLARSEVKWRGDTPVARAAYEALAKACGDLASLPLPEKAEERDEVVAVLNGVAMDLLNAQQRGLASKGQVALQLAQRACEASQWRNGGIIDTLARAHFNLGELDRAIELQKKAMELSPKEKEVRRFLGKLTAAKEKERALTEVRVFRGHRASVKHVAFAAGGQRVVSFTSGLTAAKQDVQDRKAHIPCRVWDRETGKEVLRFGPDVSWFTAIARDGTQALTEESGDLLQLWDIGTGQELWRVAKEDKAASLGAVALLPGGQQCLVAVTLEAEEGDGKVPSKDKFSVRVCDLRDNRTLAAFNGHKASVWRAEVSPDGKRALTMSSGLVCLWQVADGKELWRQERESWEVTCIGFSWDGRRVLIGDSEGVLRVCDAENGKEVQTLRQEKGRKTGMRKSRAIFDAESAGAHEVGGFRGLQAGLSGRGLISLVASR